MNLFLNACGMRRPLQIEVENRVSRRIEIRSFDQPFAVIGRDPSCDVVLDDKQVSRRHAYLQVIGGRLFWVDLDSQLGTYGEGQALKAGWLGDGRTIAVGPNGVRRFGEAETSTAAERESGLPQGSPLVWRTYGSQELADVTVEFLNGPSESKAWPIHRVLSLIGTARRCKFRLADRSVEPFHCTLLRTPQGLFVVDLLGGEGIKVNDAPVRAAHVKNEDMLQVGRYLIRVRCRIPGVEPVQGDLSRTSPGVMVQAAGIGLPATLPLYPLAGHSTTPRTEVMPYGAGVSYPVPMERNELAESLLVPLVSQFGEMQQQMFDQFQQTMSMMVQMFGKMHESQMELVRQEFGRLNELTAEINGLKSELAEMTRKQSKATNPQPQPATRPQSVTNPRPAPATVNAAPFRPQEQAAKKVASQPPGGVAAEPRPRPEPSPGGADPGDRDVIVWLHQRITKIQDEREGRWQKILKLLPGAS